MSVLIKDIEKTGFCKEHGCSYFRKPDIECEPVCCFPWFDWDGEHGACHDHDDVYIENWIKKRQQ